MNTTNKEIKEKEERLLSFKQEVEGLRNISDAEEYAKQLAHLFLGNGLSLKTILLMAIDFGQQHPNWISVDEELPEKGKDVLVWSSGSDEPMVGYYWHWNWQRKQHMFDVYNDRKIRGNITHWMPLPQPPRKEE